jgi:hypothetical protein
MVIGTMPVGHREPVESATLYRDAEANGRRTKWAASGRVVNLTGCAVT